MRFSTTPVSEFRGMTYGHCERHTEKSILPLSALFSTPSGWNSTWIAQNIISNCRLFQIQQTYKICQLRQPWYWKDSGTRQLSRMARLPHRARHSRSANRRRDILKSLKREALERYYLAYLEHISGFKFFSRQNY
jgi:hypothetical protein